MSYKKHTLQNLPKINIRALTENRRELTSTIGSFQATVLEIPAKALTDEEWYVISQARESYSAMWGVGDIKGKISEDPLDGRGGNLYDTKHYIATIIDLDDHTVKTITLRKVTFQIKNWTREQIENPNDLLPDDIKFWKVSGQPKDTDLWEELKKYSRKFYGDNFPEFRISNLARLGTLPIYEKAHDEKSRDRTPILVALTKLLANTGDQSILSIALLCEELQKKVTSIKSPSGELAMLDFTPTEKTLNLTKGSMHLDKEMPLISRLKINVPGYFLDNESAAQFLTKLLNEKSISLLDLREAVEMIFRQTPPQDRNYKFVQKLLDLGIYPLSKFPDGLNYQSLTEILTAPPIFKFLSHRIISDQPFAKISAQDFHGRFISEIADGPYSSAVTPDAWIASCYKLLQVANEKYGDLPTNRSIDAVPVQHSELI